MHPPPTHTHTRAHTHSRIHQQVIDVESSDGATYTSSSVGRTTLTIHDSIEQKPTFAPLSCLFACFFSCLFACSFSCLFAFFLLFICLFFLLFICLFLFLPRSGIGLRRRRTIPTAEQPLPPNEKLNDLYGDTIDRSPVVASKQIAWV
jgi:hypothetical protein